MHLRRLVLLFVVLLAALTLAAQRRQPQMPSIGDTGRLPDIVVHVRVVGGPADLARQPIQVDLLGDNGFVIMRLFVDNSGAVVFGSQNPGFYRVRASGMGYITVQSQAFEVMPSEFTHMEALEIHVRPSGPAPVSGSVSAHDANAPEKARKEYDKGRKDLLDRKLSDAEEHFAKAIADYPQFDSAYVLLGSSYLMEKKQQQAHDTFKKGLDQAPDNPHLQAAMGHVLLLENQVDPAEQLLRKSVALDATNESAVALLTRAEYQKNNCDDAVKYARMAHALPQHKEAFVHLIAGACLEDKSPAEAVKEYQLLLKEDPQNPQAFVAQERIKGLQAQAKGTTK